MQCRAGTGMAARPNAQPVTLQALKEIPFDFNGWGHDCTVCTHAMNILLPEGWNQTFACHAGLPDMPAEQSGTMHLVSPVTAAALLVLMSQSDAMDCLSAGLSQRCFWHRMT